MPAPARCAQDYGGLSPHAFRKAAASFMDTEDTLGVAAVVLGRSGTAISSYHYLKNAAVAPDMSEKFDQIGRK